MGGREGGREGEEGEEDSERGSRARTRRVGHARSTREVGSGGARESSRYKTDRASSIAPGYSQGIE